MSDTILVILIILLGSAGILSLIIGLGSLFDGDDSTSIFCLLALALSIAAAVPCVVTLANRSSKAADRKMHQVCAPYGGVASQFEHREGKIYHDLYMCKKGPRVIYER
jgi:hypothetical protein